MDKDLKDYLKYDILEKELNRMLTISEAAELLGVSNSSMRRFANAGDIKSYRIGRGKHRRFRKRDLLDYLEKGAERQK